MGNVCLAPITVDEEAHQTNVQPNEKVMKGMISPVVTDDSKYNQKMIEPKVKNMKKQLAL